MKKLIIILLIMACGPLVWAQEVGLQLYSLRDKFKTDVPGSLDLIKSWGITKLEGGGTYGMSMEDFKKALSDRDLEVVSVGADYNELKDDLDKVIKNAKDFGAKYVMVAWIPHDGNTFTFKEAKEATDLFNMAGKRLKAAGLQLAYHAHGYEFRPYEGGTLFDYMAKNAKDFGFEMDLYWVQHAGADPLAVLNTYPDKFLLLHLKDMEENVAYNDTGHEDVETNVVLGTGKVDIAGLVKRAKELGIEYLFIEDESSRVEDQVPQSLLYLKGL
ncbi:MAG: sugar phosphate isomerase/epimerase [Maribacter sp.]|nr:sugar phosphate isomerase/epimerase [Maribacter sp.]